MIQYCSHFPMALASTLFSLSLLFFCSHALLSPGSSNGTADELALLSFKSMLSSPSRGFLTSWNTSSHYCSWPGVVCSRRQPERVVSLIMDSFNLSGRISPYLGNLSFLRKLDLGNNNLVGQIPSELGHLVRLQVLNLSTNSLHGNIPVAMLGCTNLTVLDLSNNQLQGEMPAKIGTLKNLRSLGLHTNGLSGEIPPSLAELLSVEYLSLRKNRLSGEIPSALGNLSNLDHLDLGDNMLLGSIPSSLGQLFSLSLFNLGSNNLTGLIPASIWNVSSLVAFSVEQNMLHGTIPSDAFNNLSHLQIIKMGTNKFHGFIPISLTNASDLSTIELNSNFLSGIIPPELERLTNINWLQISNNFLLAKDPKDWEFMSALTNCSQLGMLDLGANNFTGVLPDSLSNLSSSLSFLSLSENAISGSIPTDIGNLVNLQSLDLSNNYFTGTLPSSFSRLNNLQMLSTFSNRFSGQIPLTIGNLTELNYFDLDTNAFSGRIPSTLGNMKKLLALGLSNNNFTGKIPVGILNIPTLSEILELSNNNLEGSIPEEVGNLKNLVEFHAYSNMLSGEIPSTLGECQLLRNLYLQNNILTGRIPSALSQLKGLENLDLSSNNLSGRIPMFLGNISMLSYLNLSFNNFVGEVPNFGVFANASAISIQGNGKLCGGIPDLQLPPCSSQSGKREHTFQVIPLVIALVAAIFILMLICIFVSLRKRTTKIPPPISTQGHLLISYGELVRATDSFSTTNLLGSGAFGTVFKGNIGSQAGEDTSLVAVKVLKLQTPGALKSFLAECEALRNLRHRNLLKIVTACSSIDNRGNGFKAIVYDFMPNGSLEDWLHPDTNHQTGNKCLNLFERVTMLLDVANALDYLHCHGPAPVVHCDLKPSNVLLDDEMVAHVGDFGVAKILLETSPFPQQQATSSMGFRGTIGYAPPEYGVGNMVSVQGDVYSYGILVLETITGKRPTDSEFIQGLNLREYVELGLQHGSALDVVDAQLSMGLDLDNELQASDESSNKWRIDCVISLARLGLSCSQEAPSIRMPTSDIIKELHAIKESLLL